MKPDQLTQDLAMIARNAIDYIRELERERDALLAALKLARPYISTYTLDGYHAEVKADAAIKAVEEQK